MQIANYKNSGSTTVQKATPNNIEENMSIIEKDLQVEVENVNIHSKDKDGLGSEISAAKLNQANFLKS